ncbi:MAG: hypothetical protein JW836_08945, partial [Deltaproteobacteria bacterium]|nr:hypothetical protein [Deltaproteobacteria bacterium]
AFQGRRGRLSLPGWSFLRLIYGGVLPPPALPLACAWGQGFPPQINREKTAPYRQSLRKRPQPCPACGMLPEIIL